MRNYFALTLLILLVACSQEIRPLKPFRPIPPTPQSIVVNGEPIEVGFSQIANSPDAYLNQLIRVQGGYVPLTVVKCPYRKGPLLYWAMVAEGLQMNAHGFERIVPLIVEGQQLIVEGVWRKYAGPVGCGKEPQSELLYYLDIQQILQPNPIVRSGPDSVAISAETNGISPPLQGGSSETTVDETVLATPPPPGQNNGYPVPTLDTSDGILVPSPTRDLSPPTPTPSNTPTPRQTSGSVAPTSTQEATEALANTPQATRTSPPTSVPRATATSLPGLITTATPETATPEPTADGTEEATEGTETPTPDGSLTPTSESTSDPDATETPEPTDTPDGPTGTPDPEATETPTPTPVVTLDTSPTEESEGATPSPTETPTTNSGYPVPTATATDESGYPDPNS